MKNKISYSILGLVFIQLMLFIFACSMQNTKTVSTEESVYSGNKFYMYDKEDRLKFINSMQSAMESKYSLTVIKKARMGIDYKEIFKQAIQAEQQIENPTSDIEQAKNNLQFLDRMTALIVSFKDTHLSFFPILARPSIFNGISLTKIGSEYFVTSIADKIMALNEVYSGKTGYYNSIKPGIKVVSINGKPVADELSALLPYAPASSAGFADIRATGFITTRSVAYPSIPYADYEFTNGNETFMARMPFYFNPKTNRKDALFYLNSLGFKSVTDINLQWDETNKKWLTENIVYNGYNVLESPKELMNEQKYFNSADASILALKTGYLFKEAKVYAVLQLLTYSSPEVKNERNPNQTIEFLDAIRAFVLEVKKNGAPLILDLRKNPGGNGRLPPAVLAILARKNEVYPSYTSGYRLTRTIRQMFEGTDMPSIGNINDYDFDINALDALAEAIKNNSDHTYFMSKTADITADPKIQGFENKIVALVTPNCISACDIQSMLLKASRRAVILGTHSNGTGAGFTTDGPYVNTEWKDDFDIGRLKFPNHLFGFPGEVGKNIYKEADAYLKFNSENRPTEADIIYNQTLEDYLNADNAFFAKAIELLN